jgi:hypothetical protein
MCVVAVWVPHCSHRWRKLTISINPYSSQKKGCKYKFYTEFQPHEPEFNYLKSLEIEEKMNQDQTTK